MTQVFAPLLPIRSGVESRRPFALTPRQPTTQNVHQSWVAYSVLNPFCRPGGPSCCPGGGFSQRYLEQLARERIFLELFDLDVLGALGEPLDCFGAEEVDDEVAGLVQTLAVVDALAEVGVVSRAGGVDTEAARPENSQNLLREETVARPPSEPCMRRHRRGQGRK